MSKSTIKANKNGAVAKSTSKALRDVTQELRSIRDRLNQLYIVEVNLSAQHCIGNAMTEVDSALSELEEAYAVKTAAPRSEVSSQPRTR